MKLVTISFKNNSLSTKIIRSSLPSHCRNSIVSLSYLKVRSTLLSLSYYSPKKSCSSWHPTEHQAGTLHSWYYTDWTWWAGSSEYLRCLSKIYARGQEIISMKVQRLAALLKCYGPSGLGMLKLILYSKWQITVPCAFHCEQKGTHVVPSLDFGGKLSHIGYAALTLNGVGNPQGGQYWERAGARKRSAAYLCCDECFLHLQLSDPAMQWILEMSVADRDGVNKSLRVQILCLE